MEKMTLLDFMVLFLTAQTKPFLVNEILRLETTCRKSPAFLEYWERLADNCQVEIVNEEPQSYDGA